MMSAEQLRERFQKELISRGPSARAISLFRGIIYDYFDREGRELAWRPSTRNKAKITPYHIVVSEIMLQQTQVPRVIVKYDEFIRAFPDFKTLAVSLLPKLLKAWQGMGYNRRALMLKKLAVEVVTKYKGKLPNDPILLEELPGIGPATAASIAAFAFNKPVVFIETNIRSVFIHFFFSNKKTVRDDELMPLVAQALDRDNPARWYAALMDYGTVLKKQVRNPSRKSAHYAKQSKFEGSNRQLRGKILRLLIEKKITARQLAKELGCSEEKLEAILAVLAGEGLLQKQGEYYLV